MLQHTTSLLQSERQKPRVLKSLREICIVHALECDNPRTCALVKDVKDKVTALEYELEIDHALPYRARI
jgi:hypothetical protein